MKKIAGLILIVVMSIAALAGCRNGTEPETTIPGGENLTPSSSMFPSTSQYTTNTTGSAMDDMTGANDNTGSANRNQPRRFMD